MLTLTTLLHAAGISAPDLSDVAVDGLAYDSRRAAAGTLFVAIPGQHSDGHAHAAAAVAAGAVAVVAERIPDPPLPPSTPLVLVSDARAALSPLAAAIAGHPSRALCVAGITGTDGKTTTATMLHACWRGAGMHAGAMTTVDFRQDDAVERNTTRQTTLEAVDVQERLAALRDAHCSHVAMETSSHALVLHRVDDVTFRAAVYTRITSEHLDFHGTRAAYLDAKAHLIDLVAGGTIVIDADDDFAAPVLRARATTQTVLGYSASGAGADLRCTAASATPTGTKATIETPWGRADLQLRMAGRFNVANALAAIGGACATGAPLDDAVRGLGALEHVTGRMERVDAGQPFTVVIDYAHTAGALETVLRELRTTTAGRLWVVFGSAGERDRGKRPAMGRIAAEFADRVVITDEDPRGEPADAILAEIAAGARAGGGVAGQSFWTIADRSAAIGHAIHAAQPGDTVLLAGKGHEASIIGAAGSQPWDERGAALAALRERT